MGFRDTTPRDFPFGGEKVRTTQDKKPLLEMRTARSHVTQRTKIRNQSTDFSGTNDIDGKSLDVTRGYRNTLPDELEIKAHRLRGSFCT